MGKTYTIYLRLLAIKGFDAIRSGYNCFISMTISIEWRCGFYPLDSLHHVAGPIVIVPQSDHLSSHEQTVY